MGSLDITVYKDLRQGRPCFILDISVLFLSSVVFLTFGG